MNTFVENCGFVPTNQIGIPSDSNHSYEEIITRKYHCPIFKNSRHIKPLEIREGPLNDHHRTIIVACPNTICATNKNHKSKQK